MELKVRATDLEIVKVYLDLFQKYGKYPTLREVAFSLGLSTCVVSNSYNKLIKLGLFEYISGHYHPVGLRTKISETIRKYREENGDDPREFSKNYLPF